jgi:tetratricopeptide (TPR) repeat protein
MGFRFRKSIKILPGLRINLSKSGPSLSVGRPGATLNIGRRGARTTVGAPGTGIFYTTERSWGTLTGQPGAARSSTPASRGASGRQRAPAPPTAPAPQVGSVPSVPSAARLELSFFQRLSIADDEEALVDGCKELALGDPKDAYVILEKAVHLADGAYLAGLLALQQGMFGEAATYLSYALEQQAGLGSRLRKYGIAATVAIPITEELSAVVGPTPEGVMLALAEAYQHSGRRAEAQVVLRELQRLQPDDLIVRLSLAEALLDSGALQQETAQEVLRLTESVENASDYHALLILYRAKALAALNLRDGARDLLTAALRRTKDRAPDVLLALRYERALLFEQLGQAKESRADLERIYAADQSYEDVASRLGLGKT